MTPSGCVRGRSATPWQREEKVLYNLLFVVWPQVSTCGKKEPVSTHCTPRPVPQEEVRHTPLFRMVASRPYLPCLPLLPIDSDHVTAWRKQALSRAIPPYILCSDTDDVGRARHKAGPIPYDQHPCHRDNRFFPAAARMPYPREF